MSLSANLKNHRFQVQYLNLSDEATRMLWDNKKQPNNQKMSNNSLSRALSETCLDGQSLQQVKEMIFWTRDERLTFGSSQQRRTRNGFNEGRNEMSSADGRGGQNFLYFPHNRQHHYLNDVELSTEIFNDVDLRFGCPTKTSLLRSRQRAASTSALSKHLKAQILRIQLKTPAVQKSIYSERARTVSEVGADDSYYGYLTGGRYNWAHLIDGKSRSDLGLYVPRSNPQKTFFVAKINKKEKKKGSTPVDYCPGPMQDEECQVQIQKPKQITIDLNKREPFQFVVQPQPLYLRDLSDKVPDSDMEESRQDPPPTPVSAYPVTKDQKLTGVMTTSAVHLKEKSRVGLNEGVQNIWTNTIS